MTSNEILKIFDDNPDVNILEFTGGKCHDCGHVTMIEVEKTTQSSFDVFGGALYRFDGELFIKCFKCWERNPKLTNCRKTEVYSRVVGYLRPVKQWNPGKLAEFNDRKEMRIA